MKVECKCIECGKPLLIFPCEIKENGNFCSKPCWYKWKSKNIVGIKNPLHKPKIIKICEECGKEYEAFPYELDTSRFCSIPCKNKNMTTKILCTCLECGKEFKVIQSTIKKGDGKFCSKKCYGNNRIKKVQCKCLKCNKEFEVVPAIINRDGGKFCCKECQYKYMVGVNSIGYVHGESLSKYCYIFHGVSGVRIRALIFAGYKCEECGRTNSENISKSGMSLSVHHVYYRKMSCCENEVAYESGVLKIGNVLHIKESNGNINRHEIIGKPEKFVVLCSSCHSKTTSKNRYGWIKRYENLINTKYGGKSFLTKEEFAIHNQK